LHLIIRTALIGISATLVMDAWVFVQRRAFGVKPLDYALVGRWLGHMPAGRFRHAGIAAAPAIRGERLVGWIMHYATGVLFAALLPAVFGADWIRQPTPGPAIAIGLVTVAAPFFLMQPCLGFGIAASRMPRPAIACPRSLMTHLVFGIGLYAAAWALAQATAESPPAP
jgi:hypothetical protein